MITRRKWLLGAGGVLAAAALGAGPARAAAPKLQVWKTPTCGCCSDWVAHMRSNGFEVTASDLQDLSPIKRQLGVAPALASCHTGVVNGYVVEGHVPADLVHRMLEQRPAIVGLAVPGMPQGSPGMETGRKDAYDVVAWNAEGETSVYDSR